MTMTMTGSWSRWFVVGVVACMIAVGAPPYVSAQQPTPSPTTDQPASQAISPAPEQPTLPSLLPAMAGPLVVNPKPLSFDVGPIGKWYITGAVSGLVQWQSNPVSGDDSWLADVSNAQVFINKPDGIVQFFAQAGAYSLPALGVGYIHAGTTTNDFFGPFPQGFLKIAPTENFSIMGGKLPTLIGAEYTFTFENMNIQRGLLWNQENAVNRGVQGNYTLGPVAFAVSWNDGFYSNQLSWVWGSVTWTIDSANTLAFVGGGNTRHSRVSSAVTPLFQNNEQIYNLIYTHTKGSWTIQPYFQYTHVPRIPGIGALDSASTYGGAVLVNYRFPSDATIGGLTLDGLSLPARVEYIASTGNAANGAPNLLYGPGSQAWSITVTPTYQWKIFFARGEFSFVGGVDTTAGLAFGSKGNDKTQTRLLLEVGLLF